MFDIECIYLIWVLVGVLLCFNFMLGVRIGLFVKFKFNLKLKGVFVFFWNVEVIGENVVLWR